MHRSILCKKWSCTKKKCESEEEYDSQEFSVEILNAIFNQAFPHYFIEMDEYEEEDEDE